MDDVAKHPDSSNDELASGQTMIPGGLSESEVERRTRSLHKLLATLKPANDWHSPRSAPD
ncbi:hypothetical protein XH89_23540 [Bradyrhizobium sp. CCBAU 53340]|nr:hypothetical protein XH89_23540 [Bradyrhizobium sp. CCBAU 53340]